VAVGSDAMNRSLSCDALKWMAVGMRRECSKDPCVRTRGRREEDDRGVETPVWGPLPPAPLECEVLIWRVFGDILRYSIQGQFCVENEEEVACHTVGNCCLAASCRDERQELHWF